MGATLQALIYCRDPEAYRARLERLGSPARLLCAGSPEEAAQLAPSADVLFSWHFPPELYASARRLRWVQAMGAGVDDIVAAPALDRAVWVTRIVDQFGGMIAEYVFSELLARVRDHAALRLAQAQRSWKPFKAGTLAGATIGIAGLGSIGGEIVRKARAFDQRVYGLSRTARAYELVDRGFGQDEWLPFVRDLDVLVLALPLTPATEGVVGARVLEAMRPKSLLVNVGRGRLVREVELVRALQERKLSGAILDVFEEEPLPAESPLWTLPGVTVTPHVSGPSIVDQVAQFFHENLQRFAEGRTLQGMVDRAAGY